MDHLTSPAFSHGGSQRLSLFSVLLWPLPAASSPGWQMRVFHVSDSLLFFFWQPGQQKRCTVPLLALTVENVNGKCLSGAQLFSLAQTFFILHVFHVARPIFLKLCITKY